MTTTFRFTLTLTAATGNQDSPRNYAGRVVAVGFKFVGVPGTTVLTLTTKGSNGPANTILVTPAGNTNVWYYPQMATVKAIDGTAIASWYVDPQVDDFMNLAAASSGAGTVELFMILEN